MPSQIKVDEIKNVAGQYEIKTNTFKGQTTGGSIAVQGEGTNTTNLQQGIAKVWCSWDGDGGSVHDSFNQSSITDTSNTENTVSYTNSFRAQGCMSLHYSSNHNAGGFDMNSSSYLCIYSPNPGSAKFYQISNQNCHYQTMTGHGDLA